MLIPAEISSKIPWKQMEEIGSNWSLIGLSTGQSFSWILMVHSPTGNNQILDFYMRTIVNWIVISIFMNDLREEVARV